MSRDQFAQVRNLLENAPWDYFEFVELGLHLVQRAFWDEHDSDGPFADVVRDYYLHLDEQLAGVLDLLTEETAVLIVSTRGAQRLQGGFRINEWLVREGLLTLRPRSKPDRPTPIHRAGVDWSRTKVWAETGDVARLYLNVKGREPEGTVEPADCERFREDLKTRLEAIADADGEPLEVQAFKPEVVYRAVRGVAPDLLVQFGGLAWRPLSDLGAGTLHARPSDAVLGACAPHRTAPSCWRARGSPRWARSTTPACSTSRRRSCNSAATIPCPTPTGGRFWKVAAAPRRRPSRSTRTNWFANGCADSATSAEV